MQEIWKDVKGYEGLYQVSNLGRVKSFHKNRIIILRNAINSAGYNSVVLVKDKIKKNKLVHRLISIAFIPNPFNKPEVNHKNGIRSDNTLSNLEWCTHKENIIHSFKYRERIVPKSSTHKLSKKVKQMTKEGELIKIWDSTMDIQRELKIPNTNISLCCREKHRTAKNYKWEYLK